MFIYPNKPTRIYDVDTFASKLDSSWIVQSKWDGKRCLPFCDIGGKITLYSRHKTILRENCAWLSDLPINKAWLLDGEILRDGRIIVWDYAVIGGKSLYNTQYLTRIDHLKNLVRRGFNSAASKIEVIETLPASMYKVLLENKDPMMEGLVFKNKYAEDFWGIYSTKEVYTQFKYRIR